MDDFLHSLGGCGRFQIIFSTFVILPQLGCAFSSIFMAFGSYNPGWRCLDREINASTIYNHSFYIDEKATRSIIDVNNENANHTKDLNDSSKTNVSDLLMNSRHTNKTRNVYYTDDTEDMCKEFKSCRTVYFDPSTSTVASEWGLLCSRSWILSLITSLQMAGAVVGAMIVGYLGDTFGRKWTLYSSVAISVVLEILAMQSISWQMFAVFKLAGGITSGVISFIPHVYISESVIQKWRCVISGLPVWTFGTIIFSVAGMLMKDWKTLHVFNAGLYSICLLPVFWVPESIRWLMVKQKIEKSYHVVEKITRVNKIGWVPSEDLNLPRISEKLKQEVDRIKRVGRKIMVLQLFTKNKWVISLVVGASRFTGDLVYFVTSFVVPSMPGNFYTNLILISVMDLPGHVIASVIPNIFGRKRSLVAAFGTLSAFLSLVIVMEKMFATGSENVTISVLVLTILARTSQNISYCVLVVFVNELYPTIIRSTANGYAGFAGCVGSILAPYLLPTISGSLSISYLILGSASFVCTFLLLLLPETKGQQMPDV